jgi:hypothetical protein
MDVIACWRRANGRNNPGFKALQLVGTIKYFEEDCWEDRISFFFHNSIAKRDVDGKVKKSYAGYRALEVFDIVYISYSR